MKSVLVLVLFSIVLMGSDSSFGSKIDEIKYGSDENSTIEYYNSNENNYGIDDNNSIDDGNSTIVEIEKVSFGRVKQVFENRTQLIYECVRSSYTPYEVKQCELELLRIADLIRSTENNTTIDNYYVK